MHRHKRILVCWHAYPGYIPPFVLSDRQVVIGPKLFADQPQMMFACWTQAGAYDLKFALKSSGIAPHFEIGRAHV